MDRRMEGQTVEVCKAGFLVEVLLFIGRLGKVLLWMVQTKTKLFLVNEASGEMFSTGNCCQVWMMTKT